MIDSRGFNLVPDAPNLEPLNRGLMGIIQGVDKKNERQMLLEKEANEKEMLRQGGVFSQISRIEDPDQYNAFMQQMIDAEPNSGIKKDLMTLASMPLGQAKNYTAQLLRGRGMQSLMPEEYSNKQHMWDTGEIVKMVGQDENGKPLYQRFTTSKMMGGDGRQQIIETPIGEPTNDPSKLPNAMENYAGGYGSKAGGIDAELASSQQTGDAAASKEQKIAEAKAGVEIQNAYKIAFEQSRAKAQQTSMQANAESMNSLEQIKPLFSMADEAIANPKGFYTGDLMSQFESGVLPYVGFVVDQDKLNNTTQLRMALTNLKVGAKPQGSGNPTPSEWDMFAQTIPDPMLATPGQLVSAYRRYQKLVNDKYAQLRASGDRINSGGSVNTAAPTSLSDEKKKELDAKYGM